MTGQNSYLKILTATLVLAAIIVGGAEWLGMRGLALQVAFWCSAAISFLASLVAFRDLSDFSQFYLKTTREQTMWTWYNRRMVLAVALLFFAAAWALKLFSPVGVCIWVLLVLSAVCGFLIFSGYINPWIMMRARQDNGRIVPVSQAADHVQPDESVIVTEVNGQVRAHPDHQVLRPHVAGGQPLGGEDVVMTYCGLTNLGIAVSPELDGQRMNLRPVTQLHNNLVLVDSVSGEPIQQLWMQREKDRNAQSQTALKEWPSFRMPFSKYQEAYPEGEVFLNDYRTHDTRSGLFKNPFIAIYDFIFDFAFDKTIKDQEELDAPFFPTLSHSDQRLASKEKVFAFNIGDDFVAYSEPFVRAQNGPLNVTVGGENIVVAYDEMYQSLGVFHNPSDTQVAEINHYGDTGVGRLQRVETLKAGAYWIVWSHFFPNTDVNRV